MNKQNIIRDFYKEFLSYRPESMGAMAGAFCLEVIYGIYMWVPFKYHTNMKVDVLMLLFGFFGTFLYLSIYLVYSELGQHYSIVEKMRYLPVSSREIKKFLVHKLWKYTGVAGAVFAIGQLALSLLIAKQLGWNEFAFSVGCGFLFPFSSNLILVIFY